MRTRWYLRRARKANRRRIRRLAQRTSAIWLTEQGPSLDAPVAVPRGTCHICAVGRYTLRDEFSGVRCCDHCGAPMDQMPGAVPRDGVAADRDHIDGTCECRSVGRVDLDARERERAYV